MASQYRIVYEGCSLDDVIAQIRSIDEFPAAVHIYDRAFVLSTKDEAWALLHGIEVSWYMCEEYWEKEAKRNLASIEKKIIAGN
jgi:hypothetical protein